MSGGGSNVVTDQNGEFVLALESGRYTITVSKPGFVGTSHLVDLPEGVSVRCNLIDVEPDPAKLRFGMPVEMTTGVSQQDREGNDVVAFYFRPVER